MRPRTLYRAKIEKEKDDALKRQVTPKNEDSEELFLCPIICGKNPKPICYGDYPNCRLYYRTER